MIYQCSYPLEVIFSDLTLHSDGISNHNHQMIVDSCHNRNKLINRMLHTFKHFRELTKKTSKNLEITIKDSIFATCNQTEVYEIQI